MQFGRVSGIGLMVLGLALIVLQGGMYLTSRNVNPAATPQTPATTEPARKTSSLPGIVGGGLFIAGALVLATARRRDEPDPQHAVK